MVFDSISSNIDDVLSINSSADVLSLETLKAIIRIGLPILVELIDLVYSVIIFLSQMTYLGWLTFPLGSFRFIYLFLISFLFLCSTMAYSPFGKSDHVLVSVSIVVSHSL